MLILTTDKIYFTLASKTILDFHWCNSLRVTYFCLKYYKGRKMLHSMIFLLLSPHVAQMQALCQPDRTSSQDLSGFAWASAGCSLVNSCRWPPEWALAHLLCAASWVGVHRHYPFYSLHCALDAKWCFM